MLVPSIPVACLLPLASRSQSRRQFSALVCLESFVDFGAPSNANSSSDPEEIRQASAPFRRFHFKPTPASPRSTVRKRRPLQRRRLFGIPTRSSTSARHNSQSSRPIRPKFGKRLRRSFGFHSSPSPSLYVDPFSTDESQIAVYVFRRVLRYFTSLIIVFHS